MFSLNEPLKYDEVCKAVTDFGLLNIDMDQLYEEFCQIKPAINLVCNENHTTLEKWNLIFLANTELKNFLIILQFVFSIFGSNADAERIFTMCSASWTDARNRLSIEHIKAELQIKINYSYTCKEFYDFLRGNKKLMIAAKTEKKI